MTARTSLVAAAWLAHLGQLITQLLDLGCRPGIEGRVLGGQPSFLPLDHSASPGRGVPKGSTSAPVCPQWQPAYNTVATPARAVSGQRSESTHQLKRSSPGKGRLSDRVRAGYLRAGS